MAQSRVDRRPDDARVVREPQVVVAAEGEVFPPLDDDARSLGAFACEALPREARTPDVGEPLCDKLKDHRGWAA